MRALTFVDEGGEGDEDEKSVVERPEIKQDLEWQRCQQCSWSYDADNNRAALQ